MTFRNLFVASFFAASALTAGAALALAEGQGLEGDLAEYHPIRAALAADSLDGVKDHAAALGRSGDGAVAKAAETLQSAADIEAARKSFGDLSKAVLAEAHAAMQKGVKLPAIYVFQCPMAKPYGKWLQETDQIGNPYMGAKMLKCGKLVASMGTGAGVKKAPANGEGCCGQCAGEGNCPNGGERPSGQGSCPGKKGAESGQSGCPMGGTGGGQSGCPMGESGQSGCPMGGTGGGSH